MLNLEQVAKYSKIYHEADSVVEAYCDIAHDLGRDLTDEELMQVKLYNNNTATATFAPQTDLFCIGTNCAEDKASISKVDRMKELAEKIAETYRRKNADYGDSFGISVHKYGIITALTRMSDKWNRLENLILNMDKNSVPNVADESVLDTLLDMATYALMTYMEIERM